VQRLVTVHGPGGSGKTRLAVEVAQTLLGTLGCLAWGDSRGDGRGDAAPAPFDRIAFVSLIDCTDATLTLDAICSALHLDRDVIDNRTRIAAALAGRRTLLVLDNVEQLLDEARLEIARLLRTVATVHVLVTSRRLLELDGEVAFELDGLPLPALEGPLAELTDNPAVALFVDRARAAKAGFELTPRNAQAIGALVRLLTGMPLAVELAASHMGNLTPQELLQQVRPGAGTPMLDLLERPAARACLDARHASMRRVVAWSWRQLTSAQAEMLLRMAIFDTPARLELIAAVAAMALPAARTVLGALRGASLVQSVESAEGVTRYALLQPVREFAAERTAGADACAVRQRLRRWLIAFAREAIRLGPSAVAPDVAHVHAAILSAPGDGASKEAVELAVALRWYWDSDSLPLSDLRSLERAVGEISDEALRADGLELLAFGRGAAGFVAEAIAHAEAALALARDDRRRSLVLARWAWTIYMAGRFDVAVEPALEEASTLARRSGDLVAQGMVLRMQAIVACNYRLDYAGAEGLSARAQQIWEQVGHRSMAYSALLTRATMWAWLGRNEDAVTVLLECERVARVEGDWMGWVTATTQMGRVYIRMRRSNDAVAAFRRSITVAWQRHSAPGLARALVHLPEALAMGTEVETAARLCGFAVPHWWHLFKEINRIEARELRRTRLLLHLRLGAARSETLRIEGSGLSIASAVALALGADLMP
jgi:predicted ATPase